MTDTRRVRVVPVRSTAGRVRYWAVEERRGHTWRRVGLYDDRPNAIDAGNTLARHLWRTTSR